MKNNIWIFFLFFWTIGFTQNSLAEKEYSSDLKENAKCLTLIIYTPDEIDISVILTNNLSSWKNENKNHFHIESTELKTQSVIDLLKKYGALNELFAIDDNGYSEITTNRKNDGEKIKLFIQIDFGEPCHNSMEFVLISKKRKAKKLLNELAKLYDNNHGFSRLKKQIKT